jgi:hypothetical protein
MFGTRRSLPTSGTTTGCYLFSSPTRTFLLNRTAHPKQASSASAGGHDVYFCRSSEAADVFHLGLGLTLTVAGRAPITVGGTFATLCPWLSTSDDDMAADTQSHGAH